MHNREVFGQLAREYRVSRPSYPPELFEHLASLCPMTRAALDCATGNGQAAIGLAAHFDRVAAFDMSGDQVENAVAHPRVEYRVGSAESPPFEEDRFDLVTVAQAAHWLDLPAFYEALRSVTHEDTVVAIWGYAYSTVEPQIDAAVDQHLVPLIDPFWAPGNRVVIDGYAPIPFPFRELQWPKFEPSYAWTLDEYMSYIRTWSAVKLYERERGADPVSALETALQAFWPAGESKQVGFELVGRVGRMG